MISKDRLTSMLRDACDLEEGSMEFLTTFVERYFDWTGVPPDKVSSAKKLIEKLRTDSEKHNKAVEDMITWISERRENEF